MDTNHKEYMETGLLGAYHPKQALRREWNDKVIPIYRDTVYTEGDKGLELSRTMMVGGKTFVIHSIFHGKPTATPTQTMLRIIEKDMKK